ncbi:MAG: YccF domain-containing protein [Rhodospirillaceae bacterium]|nr:YccF domain-containing protein [Rhodospirillales bacterium]
MSLILNVIWVIFGGFFMALGWMVSAVIMAVTIIGLPWARACLNIALYALWPFGKEAVSRKLLTGKDDLGTGALCVIGNIVWFVLVGIWLALGHVGKAIVSKEMAAEARRRAATQKLDAMQATA